MTEPLRFGILGAARISDLSIIEPAHQLGHRLVAVAAHHRQRAEQYAVENDIERVNDSLARCSLVGAIREGSPFPTTSADAVENMILIDGCYCASGLERRQTMTIERG